MEGSFRYVDSLKELQAFLQERKMTREEVAKASDDLIESLHKMISLILSFVPEAENQIKEWDKETVHDPSTDNSSKIELVKVIIDFYKLNGRYALLELDVNTVYKHMFMAKTEYEYRFFARRAYTLMYEAKKGLAVPTGQLYKRLDTLVGTRKMEPYKKVHSDLSDFLNKNENELKEIRNANEAHKGKDFDVQIASIEKMSVARSISLIQEFCIYLANLYFAFMVVHGSLTEYMRKRMTD